MSNKILPLGDRVIVKPTEQKETMRGGIIIPDTVKEKPQEGTILAVGPGRFDENGKRIPMDVKAGDKVLYGKFSGSEIKIAGETCLIMHQDADILGIIK
ncbi:MAG: co-chaperone GroES [Elusimicrobiaceae bacterium]|jgi:chaperonin GroES|nr:co-chaperone GroES [Elusimicrobiaceae bacterium]MBT4007646.1 co-chaperone GroES [Elusimicrobiaceae bacterium]MBT4402361.1 co-chaperone GroES [Elusimicrobiaceae bacterium]MBT5987770.1 co-chaperone GroES [Elusimicrobiaceae bacterium]MBT6715194.1 co-chaperone GroES [Elusimicrobiaceae bacterium]